MIYANENDRDASHWLTCLPLQFDVVDDRSIVDVKGHEIEHFTQCHFFAGIGGWSYALELAQWPASVPVWTGSCPCQPFSAAGKRKGAADKDKALWPEFRRLIAECRPPVVFGEQVASKDGRLWFAGIRADLEALGYAVGAADLCAAGVGAPHIRQRLFWVADCNNTRLEVGKRSSKLQAASLPIERCSDGGGLADAEHARSPRPRGGNQHSSECRKFGNDGREVSEANFGLGNANIVGWHKGHDNQDSEMHRIEFAERRSGSGWSDVEYIPCRDGKARPVKPGVRLLAHGVSGRVAQLRGLGNAIVPQVAAEFVMAFMECH